MKIQEITDLPDASDDIGDRRYLIFSDAQIEFIEANQSPIDVEFTEEEKKLSFI